MSKTFRTCGAYIFFFNPKSPVSAGASSSLKEIEKRVNIEKENQMTKSIGKHPILKDAEMYYNYHSSSGSYSYSDSTLQQSTGPSDPTYESVEAPLALISSKTPGEKETKKSGEAMAPKNVPRKISHEDYYDKINISVNEIRRGKRTDRMTAYISIKDENDKKFTIFLRSSLTTSIDETFRSLRKDNNQILTDILIEIGAECPSNAKFFSGRLRYNPRRWKIEDAHKTNLKTAIIGIYDFGTHMTAVLYMLNEPYVLKLTDDLTTKQTMFNFTGSFERDIKEELE